MKKDPKKKRKITSAIPDFTVCEVRRSLDILRKSWNRTLKDPATNPFYLSLKIHKDFTLEEFAYLNSRGQHIKRFLKSAKGRKEAKRGFLKSSN